RLEEAREAEPRVLPPARIGALPARGAVAPRHRLRGLLDRGQGLPGGDAAALHRARQRGLLVRARDLLSHPPHGRERHPGAGLVRGLARLEVQPAARGVLQVPASLRALAALPAGRGLALVTETALRGAPAPVFASSPRRSARGLDRAP